MHGFLSKPLHLHPFGMGLQSRPCSVVASAQVRDGVITLLEAWAQASSPERVLPGLAEYLASPKAAMAEGKVLGASLMLLSISCAYDVL